MGYFARFNLARADRAARRAADLLGRRAMPPRYPADPEADFRARSTREGGAVVVNTVDAVNELLQQAVDLERRGRDAQAAAIEALRHCGNASPSWEAIGRILGLSGQGAHKRYNHVEAPEAQVTIDDELEAIAP